MGGARAGEYASQIAVEKITTLLPRAFQQSAAGLTPVLPMCWRSFTADSPGAGLFGRLLRRMPRMQTTMSLCWFTPGWMYFGHVGDSRIYHLSKGKKKSLQLTEDDTHVGWLFRNGKINEYEARTHPRRNVLQKALGGENQFVDPQVGAVACERGEFFLLCSDGLAEGLYVIISWTFCADAGEETAAQKLVETSVQNSGRDNTTAMVSGGSTYLVLSMGADEKIRKKNGGRLCVARRVNVLNWRLISRGSRVRRVRIRRGRSFRLLRSGAGRRASW